MLVIHRANEPPKLTVRAPAPAHRVWAVRLVVALLVVLLVVSNTALGARLKKPGGHPPSRELRDKAHRQSEQRKQQDRNSSQQLKPGSRPWQPKHPAQADGRQADIKLQPSPTPGGAEHRQLLLLPQAGGASSAAERALQEFWQQTIKKQSGDNIRALWGDYARQEPPRLKDGRYALPKLNELESALPAQQVYRLTKEILQQHPVELLERDADGHFMAVSMSTITSGDKNNFLELIRRHTDAMTDLLGTIVHNEISDQQSSESPTQSESGKRKLSVPDLKQSLLDLPRGEKSVETPSVAQRGGFMETNLSEVSKIDVQGDSPNTLLDIKLKPRNDQSERYLGRANLDTMIDTINTAMDKFLNARP